MTDAIEGCAAGLALAATLGLALFALPLLVDVPLLDPDEGLHASIAREMVERHDLTVPTFLGEPFLDKPILFFWTQAWSLRVLGLSEQAVRLPGLLFGWLGAVTTGLVAWRLLGASGGLLAGVAYATLFFPLALAQAAVHDIALVPFVNLAVLALLPLAREPESMRWVRAGALAGLWLGLAVLTKGLAGVVFAGIAVTPLLVLRRGVRPALLATGLLTVVVAAAIAAPWYLAMERLNPGYLHYYFLERHVGGYASDTQRHSGAAWWYYFPVLLGGGLPWIAFLPAGARVGLRRAASPAVRDCLVVASSWLAGGLIFVSLGSAKLSTYLLPVFPAVALFAGLAWRTAFEPGGPLRAVARPLRADTWVACVASGLVVVAAGVAASQVYGLELTAGDWALVAAVAAAWLLPAVAWAKRGPRTTFGLLAACTALTVLSAVAGVMLSLAGQFSARDLALHYNRAGQLPLQLLFVDERVGSFPFYLSSALRKDLSPDRMRHVTPSEAFTMQAAAPDTVLVLTTDRAASLAAFLDWSAVPAERAGHHVMVPAEAFIAAVRAGGRSNPPVP